MVCFWVPLAAPVFGMLGALVAWALVGRYGQYEAIGVAAAATALLLVASEPLHAEAVRLATGGSPAQWVALDTTSGLAALDAAAAPPDVWALAAAAAAAVYFADRLAFLPSLALRRAGCLSRPTAIVDPLMHLLAGLLAGASFGVWATGSHQALDVLVTTAAPA